MGNVPDKSLTLNGDVHAETIKMADELSKTVKEIQISQRFMLKRLNELYHTSDGQCTCARKQEQYIQDIRGLQSKIVELERIIDEKNTFQNEKEKEYKDLKERIELIETALMTLQTDDSKLRSASINREKVALENGHIVTEKVKANTEVSGIDKPQIKSSEISHVYHAHGIEYSAKPMERSDPSESRSPTTSRSVVTTKETKTDLKVSSSTRKKEIPEKVSSNELTDNVADDRTKQTIVAEGVSRLSKPPVQGDECAGGDTNPKMKPKIEMVEQTIRKTHGNEQYWRYLAQIEINDGKRSLKDLEGVHTVICLDISASMAEGNAWRDALKFVQDYLNGLEDVAGRYGLTNEHVALVTFGHETKVQQRLTNNYKKLRQLVENQRLGGPSPLYGGLVLSLAAAGSSDHQVEIVNHVTVFGKVIIVTDGRLTEVGQYEGPDVAVENLDETKAKLLQCMEEYKNSHLDAFYVQVGKGSEKTREFSELMMAVVDGKRLDSKSGRQFSRRLYLTAKIQDPLGLISLPLFGTGRSFEDDCSEEDKRMIEEIKSDARKNLFSGIGRRTDSNKYREMKGSNYPPIGSRVRRGPDWKWNMQDSNGPGTVTGHDDDEQVWVEWDVDGHHNVYRYGQPGYDVLIVDEPRKLEFAQEIAVGCVVRPGKDWTKTVGNAQSWQKGVVIKVNDPKATVRWDNGDRGDYSYSGTGKCEIEVCTSRFRAFGSEGHVLGSGLTAAQPEKKKKNKNKNVH